jgi:hypothetical protein
MIRSLDHWQATIGSLKIVSLFFVVRTTIYPEPASYDRVDFLHT